jgi:ATP-binding cassette, subfamily B, bacterial
VSELDRDTPKGKIGNLRMVFGYLVRYPVQISLALFFLTVSSAATLAIPMGFKKIVDEGFDKSSDQVVSGLISLCQSKPANYTNADTGLAALINEACARVPATFDASGLDQWFYILIGIVIVLALATAARFYFVSWLGERVVADIRNDVQTNLLGLSPAYFEENRPSEIASRLTADTTIIENIVGTTLSVALRNLVMCVGAMILLIGLAPNLALMIVLGIPAVVLPIILMGRKIRNASRVSQDKVAEVGAMVDEVLGAMKIVQAFGQESRETDRFKSAVNNVFSAAKKRFLIRAVMTSIVIGLMMSAITLVIWQGVADVASGEVSGGTIFAFVLYSGLAAGAFGALAEVYGDLLRGAGASERLGELLGIRPTITAPAQPKPLPEPPLGQIVFDHVRFSYPTRPDVSALKDFSLTIKPGEKLAIVGPSGAGKSTLFQLIQRFYDPDAGRLLIDGVALPEADPKIVRQRIAMVPQETTIFAANARDNLKYGCWDATDDQIWAAAAAANAEEFLRKLPEGLDTYMGEGGARLSGGQRQRVAIARAILRDAPILLLDEATSALDAESERLVQDALERLMEGKTSMVIAHRLATVRAADRIIVMNEGQIVEEGKHNTLVKAGGLYAKLAKLQFTEEP